MTTTPDSAQREAFELACGERFAYLAHTSKIPWNRLTVEGEYAHSTVGSAYIGYRMALSPVANVGLVERVVDAAMAMASHNSYCNEYPTDKHDDAISKKLRLELESAKAALTSVVAPKVDDAGIDTCIVCAQGDCCCTPKNQWRKATKPPTTRGQDE